MEMRLNDVYVCVYVTEGIPEAVGKPVYKCEMDDLHGAWLHDSSPRSEVVGDKLWMTNRKKNSSYIYEYSSNEAFGKTRPREIRLPYPFQVRKSEKYNFKKFVKKNQNLKKLL